jgi:CRISPR type I-E-associated protein CasB/Cse2
MWNVLDKSEKGGEFALTVQAAREIRGCLAWARDHPLSPSYFKDEWRPVHPQPGGIGYRDWLGLVFEDVKGTSRPAPCIPAWRQRAQDLPATVRGGARLFAAGYDMDDMKARAFVESEMPLPGSGDSIAGLARGLITAAEEVAGALRCAVRSALYSDKTKLETAPLATVYEAFWSATQDAFFACLNAAEGAREDALQAAAPDWRALLEGTAFALFDEAAPLDARAVSVDPARIVHARKGLWFTLHGYGLDGKRLFAALLLPEPDQDKQRRLPDMTMKKDIDDAVAWWRDLQSDRGARARLRRADMLAAMGEPATYELFRALGRDDPEELPAVALCAALLATVREDDPQHPARALEELMGAIRFRRLIEAETLEDRLTMLRRAVQLAGCQMSVRELARACLNWTETTRRRWLFEYHNAGATAPLAHNTTVEGNI